MVSWRRANDLVGGGGGWGAQFDTLSDAVLLPPTQWGERGGVGASAASIQQRSAGAAGGAAGGVAGGVAAGAAAGVAAGAAEMAGAGSWLLGALAVLASSPEMARRCLVAGPHAKRGVLALRIWNAGMRMACVHGVRAWRACMACVHGVRAWRACMACVHGVRAWRSRCASGTQTAGWCCSPTTGCRATPTELRSMAAAARRTKWSSRCCSKGTPSSMEATLRCGRGG